MNYRKDYFVLPKEYPFDLFITNASETLENNLHFHDCLEINYIVSGGGFNFIENRKYPLNEGDLYIINNLERHIAVSNGNLKMLVIIFDPMFIWKSNYFDMEYLRPFFDRNVNFSNCIAKENIIWIKLNSIILEIHDEWNNKQEGYKLIIKSLLMKLLAILYRHFKTKYPLDCETSKFVQSYQRLKPVIEYINLNFLRPMKLEELAKFAHMNKTYFSTYFKEVMNINVHDFINSKRIEKACYLLRTTDNTILNISEISGFNNLTSFNKEFKKNTGCTPSYFRR